MATEEKKQLVMNVMDGSFTVKYDSETTFGKVKSALKTEGKSVEPERQRIFVFGIPVFDEGSVLVAAVVDAVTEAAGEDALKTAFWLIEPDAAIGSCCVSPSSTDRQVNVSHPRVSFLIVGTRDSFEVSTSLNRSVMSEWTESTEKKIVNLYDYLPTHCIREGN